jgi:glucose-6-phosphate isomerase
MTPLSLSYANVMAPALGSGGIDPERLDGELAERFQRARARVDRQRESGELGFLDLPGDRGAVKAIREVADSFGQWFENLVVVGIGGSSLGARALTEALLGVHWNLRSDEERDHFPRLHFLENADPDSFTELLGRIDPRRTLFNVVSKSGSTAETMAQFLAVEGILEAALGEEKVGGHLLFTTDPSAGPLRKLAEARGVPSMAIPANVGGRFSVLSPVGLLPGAIVGIDPDEVLAGAAEMARRCEADQLRENPAGLVAVLLHSLDRDGGRSVHVMMPYADRLRNLSLWFQQLWAESLGKGQDLDGRPVETGPTPLAALGAVDQHSLLQLLMEGPRDKVVLFLRRKEAEGRVEIPQRYPDEEALAYLGDSELGELLEVERRATAEALRRSGRPSLVVEVDRLDARAMGELFMLFQLATVYGGALYGVDPLDQPGVELGKRLTYGLMGRTGFDAAELAPEDAGGFRV